jgi:hypothetical protein
MEIHAPLCKKRKKWGTLILGPSELGKAGHPPREAKQTEAAPLLSFFKGGHFNLRKRRLHPISEMDAVRLSKFSLLTLAEYSCGYFHSRRPPEEPGPAFHRLASSPKLIWGFGRWQRSRRTKACLRKACRRVALGCKRLRCICKVPTLPENGQLFA